MNDGLKMLGGFDSMMGIVERCKTCNQQTIPKNECICKSIFKSTKPFWCKHIDYLEERVDGSKRYSWWIKYDDIKRNWKYCPICAAPRPIMK